MALARSQAPNFYCHNGAVSAHALQFESGCQANLVTKLWVMGMLTVEGCLIAEAWLTTSQHLKSSHEVPSGSSVLCLPQMGLKTRRREGPASWILDLLKAMVPSSFHTTCAVEFEGVLRAI
jgi:hypothetical protein